MNVKKVNNILIFGLLLVISAAFILPFIWLFFTSLKFDKEIYSIPPTIFPRNLTFVQWKKIIPRMTNFGLYYGNSIIVTMLTVLSILFISSLGGYAFGRLRFFGRNAFFYLILMIMVTPYAIYLIPIYIMEAKLHLINTRLGLILPYIGMFLPLALFIMRGTFRSIPSELEDAARIDGCNEWQIFLNIMLPLAKAGLITVAVLLFIFVWEEFLYALVLVPSAKHTTLSVGITYLADEGQSWAYGTLSCVMLLSMLPTILVFILLQRYYIKGVTEGAIKG